MTVTARSVAWEERTKGANGVIPAHTIILSSQVKCHRLDRASGLSAGHRDLGDQPLRRKKKSAVNAGSPSYRIPTTMTIVQSAVRFLELSGDQRTTVRFRREEETS